MKPRFSILTLLGGTAYASISLVGFNSPLVFSLIWMLTILIAVGVSTGATCGRVVAARAFLVGASVALIVSFSCVQVIDYHESFSPMRGEKRHGALNYLAIVNSQLAFGMLCGCVALWAHRRLERREHKSRTQGRSSAFASVRVFRGQISRLRQL